METNTLQGTNISPQNGILKMIFLFPRWDMLIPWRVVPFLLRPAIFWEFFVRDFGDPGRLTSQKVEQNEVEFAMPFPNELIFRRIEGH